MKRFFYLVMCMTLLFGIMSPEWYLMRASADSPSAEVGEQLQIITPIAAGAATGSAYFPMGSAFDGQPSIDEDTGVPVGGGGASNAPAIGSRVGYIDFGEDWSKVRITSIWTQYRASSGGNQTPYAELW